PPVAGAPSGSVSACRSRHVREGAGSRLRRARTRTFAWLDPGLPNSNARGLRVNSQANAAPEARLGQIIDERYRVVEHIASGGMASVYRAEHVHNRTP